MRKFFRAIGKTVKWCFIVFLLFLVSLFFREQRLPRSVVDRIADSVSTSNLVVRCESASVGLRRGVTLTGLKAYAREAEEGVEPVVSARLVSVNHFLRRVRVTGLVYKRLSRSYYRSSPKERHDRLDFDFPRLPEFRLVLEDPEILGLTPSRVIAQVNMKRRWLALDEIHVDWAEGGDRRMSADGFFRFDLIEQRARGEVRGLSAQRHIRPLLERLDVPSALPYMDAFTEVADPVPVEGEFDVDLTNGDFRMKLGLRPVLGRYNGVPMSRAEGILDLYVYTRGTNCNMRLGLNLPVALDEKGRGLSGLVKVDYTNGVARLGFDAKSELDFDDALRIADFMDPAKLDLIDCETPPTITVKGTLGTRLADIATNDLAFTAKLRHGAFQGFKVNDLDMDFTLRRDVLDFRRIAAVGKTGGRIDASARIEIPEFDGDRARFFARSDYRDGSLEELADFFKFDLGERNGKVDGWGEFSGPLSTNFTASLNGRGSVKITDGHLGQMKLFAGLTKQLAEKVPGVGFLVNQSQASTDYTITNGLFRSDNVFIEGNFISIKGWGTYDIPSDNLDYTVRVQFLKNDSLMGMIIHPITWPFTKLLLEFKATGPVDNPKWDYISILDRIL